MQVLFGGTFDPVHNGHVAMAMSLRDAFPDATIRVIPNRQPPHRSSRVSSAHRLAMLKLAMDEISGVTVDPTTRFLTNSAERPSIPWYNPQRSFATLIGLTKPGQPNESQEQMKTRLPK